MADEPTLKDLEQAIRNLYRSYEDVALRFEAVRVLCETAGVFSHDQFLDGLATMQARGADAAQATLANLDPQRLEWMRELLRRHTGDPQ